MKSFYNILKSCSNCNLILSVISVLFFSVFMSYAASLKIENLAGEKIISCNNENIQEGHNFEFFATANGNLPVQSPIIENIYELCFTMNDLGEDFNRDSEPTPICNNLSNLLDLNGLVGKYFVKQLISQAKLPTERALRSDILLI